MIPNGLNLIFMLLVSFSGGGPANAKGIIDLLGISTFVKYASEVLCGYPPKRAIDLYTRYGQSIPTDLPLKCLTSSKIMHDFQDLLSDTYTLLTTDLIKAYQDYMSKSKRFEKDRLIHGTLSEQKQQDYDNAKKLYEKLFNIVSGLSECLSLKMPDLQVAEEEVEGNGVGLTVWEGSGSGAAGSGPGTGEDETGTASGGYYGDAETRAFYEDLPDILALVPLSVLGLTQEQVRCLFVFIDVYQCF